ncbi:MAG: radical SAM protein [Methanomassiliicoccales archaeon]|nr:radical SAM protein [Methanomassiliicoccales archaeon]
MPRRPNTEDEGAERTQTASRHVPFITLSEYVPRVWVTLSGCNLDCRGCFSIAKKEVGPPLTVPELVRLIETSAQGLYGKGPEEVLLTGGEPTLDEEYLVHLVRSLKDISKRVTVQTNASLLTPALLDALLRAGMDELLVDVKAVNDEKHRWYTGASNSPVLNNVAYACSRICTVVNTLFIPGLVEEDEVVAIARFLADCRPLDLEFRINPFRAELSPFLMSRTPGDEELESAAMTARAYYPNTVSSRSCLKESKGGPSKTWITVFPDGRTERRGLDDYRAKNVELFGDKG